jgi:lysozyme
VEEQFELIRSILPSTDDMLPFTVDVEGYSWGTQEEANCVKALGKEGARSRILQMARLIQEHYHKVPVIYGPSPTLSDLLDDRFSEFMVWLSSFRRGSSGRPDVGLSGRNPWTLWQYTEKATVEGISGQVDANVFFGTRDQFEVFKLGQVNVPLAAVSK